jgi:PAS domain S-box-containing protein
LRQSNNLLIAAFESARDGIVITDLTGVVLHVNQALESLFGYSRDELLGRNASDLFRSDQQPAMFIDEMWKTLHDRRSWQGELVNQRKDGTLTDSSLTIRLQSEAGDAWTARFTPAPQPSTVRIRVAVSRSSALR